MRNTIIRVRGLSIVAAVLLLAGLVSRAADADQYYNGTCYGSFGPVPSSYCSTGTSNTGTSNNGALSAGQTLGGQNATTSAGAMAVNGVMNGTDTGSNGNPNAGGGSFGATFLTYNNVPSNPETLYYDDVSPAAGRLSIQGVGIGGVYSRTGFSDNDSGLGYSRVTQTAGITASYIQDFGDWGFTAVLPVTRSLNNSGYSAFDNTGVGLAVVPVYHLLFEQVDGIALDVGGVLGGQYTDFDHPSDLANGPIGLTGFENPASGQVGALVTAAKTVAAATRLSLGVSFLDDHNVTGYKVLGQDTSVTTATLGVSQGLSSTLSLTGDLTLVNYDQYKWEIDRSYGEGALALSGRLSPRASLALQVSQTFANSAWSTTSSTVNFVWWLN